MVSTTAVVVLLTTYTEEEERSLTLVLVCKMVLFWVGVAVLVVRVES